MRLLIMLAILGISLLARADEYVDGYVRKDGTYVAPHHRSSPNSTNRDNYSTEKNQNPYTGSSGSRAQDYSPGASNYGAGRSIHTGPRGGQFYHNDSGKKVYVPKR